MNLKFLFPLLGVGSGILFAQEINSQIWLPLTFIGLSLLTWTLIMIISKNPFKGMMISKFHACWIFLLFAGIGALDYDIFCKPDLPDLDSENKAYFYGKIDDIKYLADGDRLTLSIDKILDRNHHDLKCNNVKMLVKTDGILAEKGDIISFWTIPKIFENSNYASILNHQGIYLYSNVRFSSINKEGHELSLEDWFLDFREYLSILLEKSSLDRDTSAFLISLLLGDKSLLKSDINSSLSSAGLAHVLALSGMHVAIIMGILLFLLFPISLLGYHKTRKVIAIILIWGYVLLTGCSPSTVRAALMATFLVGAWLLERKNSALNALFAAVFLILLYNPLLIWNIGLQLSFFCVAAILIFLKPLNTIDRHHHPLSYKIINLILISIITTLSTWTLIAYYFHSVPLLFLPSNIVLLPLLPFFVGIGIFYLFLLSFGIDLTIISRILDGFHSLFVGTADYLSLSGDSNLQINLHLSSVILWLSAIIVLAFCIYSVKRRNRIISLSIASFLILSAVLVIPFYEENNSSKLKFVHSLTKLETHLVAGSETLKFEFPRRNISDVETKDIHILAIDRLIHPDSIYKISQSTDNKMHYLFVGPEANGEQVSQLIVNNDYQKIILHSGIGKRMKENILLNLDESYWNNIYSLRESGSIEFEL